MPAHALARSTRSSDWAGAYCVAIATLGFFLSLTFGVLLPTNGEGPDEPAHFDVVTHIARDWRLPDPIHDPQFQPRVLDFTVNGQSLKYPYVSYASMPPGPYAVSAVATKLPGSSRSVDVHQARLPQALWVLLTILVAFCAGRSIAPGAESVAIVSATLAATWPRVIFNSAYVNNDSLMVLATMGIVWRWWEGHRGGWSPRNSLWLGGFLGLSLIAKPNGWLVAALSLLVFAVTFQRPWRSMARAFALAAVTAFVVAAPWLWVATRRYGVGDVLGLGATSKLLDSIPHTNLSAATRGVGYVEMMRTYWINDFLRSFLTFTSLTTSTVVLLCSLLVCAATGLCFAMLDVRRRWRQSPRTVLLHVVTFVALPLTFIVASVNSFHHDAFYGQQGRYLLPGFPAFVLYVGVGLSLMAETVTRRWLLIAGMVLVMIVTIALTLQHGMYVPFRSTVPTRYGVLADGLLAACAISAIGALLTGAFWLSHAHENRHRSTPTNE